MSKGDKYRPVDKKKFDRNWDKIFKTGEGENHKPKETDENRTQADEGDIIHKTKRGNRLGQYSR